MISLWKHFLLEEAAEWRQPVSGKWTFVIHNNYHPQYSNLNVLWFHNDGNFPQVVVKFSEQYAPLKREYDNMQRAYDCSPAIVPRPLHFGSHGQLWGLWMEGAPGSMLTMSGRHSLATLKSLTKMVISLHAATRSDGAPKPDRYSRLVHEPLDTVAGLGSSEVVREGCKQLRSRVSPGWMESLAIIPQHGDLYSGNVLSHRGRWYVLDWEEFGSIDLPFFDLITVCYSLLREGGPTPDVWDTSLASKMPGLFRAYAASLNLSMDDLPLILPITLMTWLYINYIDGRQAFVNGMYFALEHYFAAVRSWERVFVG